MTVLARREPPPDGSVIPPLAAVAAELASVDRELSETIPEGLGLVSEASRRILRSGGKRLRPALVLLSSRAFAGITRRAMEVACALEMIHGASLLHDDVVDNTRLRRGQVTVGAYWSNKISVMMGDYLFTRALLDMSRDDTLQLTHMTSEATGRMVLGQIREIEEQSNFEITLDGYLYIIREKTAALMAVATRMGAILGKASAASVAKMEEYGLCLGMAFQIVDDCLDFWGDEELLGKPVGSDLSERKFTLPFIHALHAASPEQRATLVTLVQGARSRMSRKSMRRILSIMERLGSRAYAMDMAAQYCRRARKALHDAAPLQGGNDLEMLLDYVVGRTH